MGSPVNVEEIAAKVAAVGAIGSFVVMVYCIAHYRYDIAIFEGTLFFFWMWMTRRNYHACALSRLEAEFHAHA